MLQMVYGYPAVCVHISLTRDMYLSMVLLPPWSWASVASLGSIQSQLPPSSCMLTAMAGAICPVSEKYLGVCTKRSISHRRCHPIWPFVSQRAISRALVSFRGPKRCNKQRHRFLASEGDIRRLPVSSRSCQHGCREYCQFRGQAIVRPPFLIEVRLRYTSPLNCKLCAECCPGGELWCHILPL